MALKNADLIRAFTQTTPTDQITDELALLPKEQESQDPNTPLLGEPPISPPTVSANSVIAAQKEFGRPVLEEQQKIAAYKVAQAKFQKSIPTVTPSLETYSEPFIGDVDTGEIPVPLSARPIIKDEPTITEDEPDFSWRSDIVAPTQHSIKKGDTLSKISQKTGIPVSDLTKFNNISNPNQIQAGQKLNLSSPDAYNTQVNTAVETAATKYGIPLEYLRTLFIKESRFDQSSVSPKTKFGGNVRGIAQMTEKTMQEQVPGGDTKNVWDQIEAGAKYSKYLYDRWIDKDFEHEQALQLTSAAYNGGFSRILEAITATKEEHPSMQKIGRMGEEHYKTKRNPKRTKDGANKDLFQFRQAWGHFQKIHLSKGTPILYPLHKLEDVKELPPQTEFTEFTEVDPRAPDPGWKGTSEFAHEDLYPLPAVPPTTEAPLEVSPKTYPETDPGMLGIDEFGDRVESAIPAPVITEQPPEVEPTGPSWDTELGEAIIEKAKEFAKDTGDVISDTKTDVINYIKEKRDQFRDFLTPAEQEKLDAIVEQPVKEGKIEDTSLSAQAQSNLALKAEALRSKKIQEQQAKDLPESDPLRKRVRETIRTTVKPVGEYIRSTIEPYTKSLQDFKQFIRDSETAPETLNRVATETLNYWKQQGFFNTSKLKAIYDSYRHFKLLAPSTEKATISEQVIAKSKESEEKHVPLIELPELHTSESSIPAITNPASTFEDEIKQSKIGDSYKEQIRAIKVSPRFRKKIQQIGNLPSFDPTSAVVSINGHVLKFADGTYGALLPDGSVIGHLPERKAAYHAAYAWRHSQVMAQGGHETYTPGDWANSIVGGTLALGATMTQWMVGTSSLIGKIGEYNEIKQSQIILNNPETDITTTGPDSDLSKYRRILEGKPLTPELQTFKDGDKFQIIAELDQEAKENQAQSEAIQEWSDSMQKQFPSNNAPGVGAFAALDVIAKNHGILAASWDALVNHKAAYAHGGIASTAYTIALTIGNIPVQLAMLTTLVQSKQQEAQMEFIKTYGEEALTEDIIDRIDWWSTWSVIAEKISAGYLMKVIGKVPGIGQLPWLAGVGKLIKGKVGDKVVGLKAFSPKNIAKKAGKTAVGLGTGALGEAGQGFISSATETKGQTGELFSEPNKLAMATISELLGTGPIMVTVPAVAIPTKAAIAIGKMVAGPNRAKRVAEYNAQQKKNIEDTINEKKLKLENIENQKSESTEDRSRLDALNTQINDLQKAYDEIGSAHQASLRLGKLETTNTLLKKMYKQFADDVKNGNITVQQALEEIDAILAAQIETKEEEKGTVEGRLYKPVVFGDTIAGAAIKLELQKLEGYTDPVTGKKVKGEIDLIEESDFPETVKIIKLDTLLKRQIELTTKYNQPASSDILNAEEIALKKSIETHETVLKSESYKYNPKTGQLENAEQLEADETGGSIDPISPDEFEGEIKIIKSARSVGAEDPDYIPVDEEFRIGDIVNLKIKPDDDLDEASQGLVILEILGYQVRDGKKHVRLKGIEGTVPIDQLDRVLRTDTTPKTNLERLARLVKRKLTDEQKTVLREEFNEEIKELKKRIGENERIFGSSSDSIKGINDDSDENVQRKANDKTLPEEEQELYQNEVSRRKEKAERAEAERLNPELKNLNQVHSEILEGEDTQWKGLYTYHQEIVDAFEKFKSDKVLRNSTIQTIASKMGVHAANLNNKLIEFRNARNITASEGMGAVVVGTTIDGTRKMKYETQIMPLTEEIAKREAEATGTEYVKGTSFASRKKNGDYVTLIDKKSGNLIAALEGEARYGSFIMGVVKGYEKTSMAQKYRNQEMNLEVSKEVIQELEKLRESVPRVIIDIKPEDIENLTVDTSGETPISVLTQQLEAIVERAAEIKQQEEITDDDQQELKELRELYGAIKAQIRKQEQEIGEKGKQLELFPEDEVPKGKAPVSDEAAEPTPDVVEPPGPTEAGYQIPLFPEEATAEETKTRRPEGERGEQLKLFANFIESATKAFKKIITSESAKNLERQLGLAGAYFKDLIKMAARGGINSLRDAHFTDDKTLIAALKNLGISEDSAKILVDRHNKFKSRYKSILYKELARTDKVEWIIDGVLQTSQNNQRIKDQTGPFEIEEGGLHVWINEEEGTYTYNTEGKHTKLVGVATPVLTSELLNASTYALNEPLTILLQEDPDSTNNQGKLPDQVLFTLMLTAMTYKQQTPNNNRWGDREFAKEVFLYGGKNRTLTWKEEQQVNGLGPGYHDVSESMGRDAIKLLEMSVKKISEKSNITQEGADLYFEQLGPALGMMAVEIADGADEYFTVERHDWDFGDTEKDRLFNDAPTVYTSGPKKGKPIPEDKRQKYKHIRVKEKTYPSKEDNAALKDMLDANGTDINTSPGPLQNPPKVSRRIKGTFTDIPEDGEVFRLLKKFQTVKWDKSQSMDIADDLRHHPAVLYELMDVKKIWATETVDGVFRYKRDAEGNKIGLFHEVDMERYEASNRDKIATLQELLEANDRGELKKFHIKYEPQVHQRYMQVGRINPQQSKVTRALVKSWGPFEYSEKNIHNFRLGVAQNFGFGVTKKGLLAAESEFVDIISNPDVLAAVVALQDIKKAKENIKAKTKGTQAHTKATEAKEQAIERLAKAVSAVNIKYKGGNMSILNGLAGLSQYMTVTRTKQAKIGFSKKINTTFESEVSGESDGIANGWAMNLYQFPMWKGEELKKRYRQVGNYFGTGQEHDPTLPTVYDDLVGYIKDGMTAEVAWEWHKNNNWKTDFPQKAGEFNEEATFKEHYEGLNAAINILYPNFRTDADLRDVAKYPFIMNMYGAGMTRVSKDITNDIIKALYSRVSTIQNEYKNFADIPDDRKKDLAEYKILTVKDYELQIIKPFLESLKTIGAFGPEGYPDTDTKYAKFRAALIEGAKPDGKYNTFNLYFDEKELAAHISTTIAPRFESGLDTLLGPTKEVRKTIIEMGEVMHWAFMTHYKEAYEKKLAEVNAEYTPEKTIVGVKNDFNGDTAKAKQYARDNEGTAVYTMRPNTGDGLPHDIKVNQNFGNPWSEKKQRQKTIVTGSIKTAVDNYEAWLKGDKQFKKVAPKRREWILKKIEEGFLDDKELIYFRKTSDRSHADVLAELAGKVEETNLRPKLTRQEIHDLITDTTKTLSKVFPRIAGPLAKIGENGEILGGIDLSSSEFVRESKSQDPTDITTGASSIAFRDRSTGKRRKSTTIPSELRFISAGVAVLIRQIINMDAVVLGQTLNGSPDIILDSTGKRWVGNVEVLPIHDGIVTSAGSLPILGEGYGKNYRHYNKEHSIMDVTHQRVIYVLNVNKQLDDADERMLSDDVQEANKLAEKQTAELTKLMQIVKDGTTYERGKPTRTQDAWNAYKKLYGDSKSNYASKRTGLLKKYDHLDYERVKMNFLNATKDKSLTRLDEIKKSIYNESFSNSKPNLKWEKKITFNDMYRNFDRVALDVAEHRAHRDSMESTDGEIDSQQLYWPSHARMLNAGKNLYQQIIKDDVEPEVNRRRKEYPPILDSSEEHPTYTLADEFKDNYDKQQMDLFPGTAYDSYIQEFTDDITKAIDKGIEEGKFNSLDRLPKDVKETKDLGDITRNTVKQLFNKFTKLSFKYYDSEQEMNDHTSVLDQVIDIVSEGFEETRGIQVTMEQIDGVSQGTYEEASERLTVSVSQQAPSHRNGQSPQEIYGHEMVHAMTSIAIAEDPIVRDRLDALYNQIEESLNKDPSEGGYGEGMGWKVFRPKGTSPTDLASSYEVQFARKYYRYVFKGKEDIRHYEFLSYALTNPALIAHMKKTPVAKRQDFLGKLLELLKLIVDTVKTALNYKVYRAKDDTAFAEALAITEHLVAIQNKHKSKHKQLESKTYKALEKSDQMIRDFANKTVRDISKRVGKEGPTPDWEKNPFLVVSTGLTWYPYMTLSDTSQAKEAREKVIERFNFTLRGIAKEIGGGAFENKALVEQLLQSRVNISKQRREAETFHTEWFETIWKSKDPDDKHWMSVETREALTDVILRADLSSLYITKGLGLGIDDPNSIQKIMNLIGNDKGAADSRGILKRTIKNKLKLTADSGAIQYAEELGKWIATGKRGIADNYMNAHSIAFDHLKNPTEERIALLDAFATLSALGHLDERKKVLIKGLSDREFSKDTKENGMIDLIQNHVNFKAKSRRDNFSGNPIQMVKGYIVERMDNLTDIRLDTEEAKEKMERLGYYDSYSLGKVDKDQTHNVLYIHRNKPEVADISGIMSTTNQRNMGTTLTEILMKNPSYKDPITGKINFRKIKAKVKSFKAYQGRLAKEFKMDDKYQFSPLRDENNKITDYRIMMDHENTRNLLKPDLEFQNVFAHMHSSYVDRKNTIKNDKQTINILVHEQADLLQAHPEKFVDLLDPEGVYIDRYRKLPRPIRDYIQSFAINGQFMVRIDIMDKVFGYRQLDITQAKMFEGDGIFQQQMQQVAGLAHYALRQTVGYGKNRIVLAMPEVFFGNMFSNVAQLTMRKIPISYTINKIIEGIHEYRKYSNDNRELTKLLHLIETRNLNTKTSKEALKAERLIVRIERNKLHRMSKAGLNSLIVEDINEAQIDGYFNRMKRILFKGKYKWVGDKIPDNLQTAASWMFWTKGSLPYRWSRQGVQMTDFLGRYVMMEHAQQVHGQSFKESMHDALDAFVLFDESLIAALEAVDAVGATAFLSYWLRNQRAARKLVQTSPTAVGISAMVQEATGIPTLGNINSAWVGGDFSPNIWQTYNLFDEANNITAWEVGRDLKGFSLLD